jgi:hypothetical protein
MTQLECSNSEDAERVLFDNPTDDQIIQCIQSRHPETQSEMALHSRRKRSDYPDHPVDLLQISRCTRDRFSIRHHRFEPKWRYQDLLDKTPRPKQRSVEYTSDNGEVNIVPVGETVDMETAIRVALYFAHTDSFPDDVTWNSKI